MYNCTFSGTWLVYFDQTTIYNKLNYSKSETDANPVSFLRRGGVGHGLELHSPPPFTSVCIDADIG